MGAYSPSRQKKQKESTLSLKSELAPHWERKNESNENKYKCFMDPGRNETMVRLLELRTQRTLSSGTEGHRFSSYEGKIQAYFIY